MAGLDEGRVLARLAEEPRLTAEESSGAVAGLAARFGGLALAQDVEGWGLVIPVPKAAAGQGEIGGSARAGGGAGINGYAVYVTAMIGGTTLMVVPQDVTGDEFVWIYGDGGRAGFDLGGIGVGERVAGGGNREGGGRQGEEGGGIGKGYIFNDGGGGWVREDGRVKNGGGAYLCGNGKQSLKERVAEDMENTQEEEDEDGGANPFRVQG